MSKLNRFEIAKCLANEHALEMTPDELEQLLNAEVDKPADEIDAALVEELLMAMDMPAPDPKRMQADWPVVRKNLPKRQANRRLQKLLLRTCAAAAVLAAILFVPLRDAEAFRWTLIQKILIPVAQTFGIIIDDQTVISPTESPTEVYSVSDAPSTLTPYAVLEDVPKMHGGYVIRPDWLPDGFTFASGSYFSSIDSEIYSLDFTRGDSWLNYNVHIITSDSAIYSYDFERTLDVPIERIISQYNVTFYRNAEDTMQSAFWIHENAHYTLAGELTVDDIVEFVEHMN